MAKQRETIFKEKVQLRLKPIPHSFWIKTQMRSTRGIPDILGVVNGKYVALELKTSTGRVDKLQAWTLSQIVRARGIALVVTPENLEETIEMLNNL